LEKPTAPGVFAIFSEGWHDQMRLVEVVYNDEGTALFVIGYKRKENAGWAATGLAGFNTMAQRVIWWLRLDKDDPATDPASS
jgi:hypothetical protein